MKCPKGGERSYENDIRTYSFVEPLKGTMLMCARSMDTSLVSAPMPDPRREDTGVSVMEERGTFFVDQTKAQHSFR